MRTAMLRRAPCLALLAALACSPAAWAGEGLSLNPDTAFGLRWSARLSVTSTVAPGALRMDASTTRPRSARLLGDYHLGAGPAQGSLRLTSGLFVGPRGGLFGAAVPLSSTPGRMVMDHRQLSSSNADQAPDSLLAWPYLGLGWGSVALREGWGFNAELGLAAGNPDALRLGRVLSQGLDDLLNELRLRPVLQLGVSYAF